MIIVIRPNADDAAAKVISRNMSLLHYNNRYVTIRPYEDNDRDDIVYIILLFIIM